MIENGSIHLVDMSSSSVNSSAIIDGSLITLDFADFSVIGINIGSDSVNSAHILDASIQSSDFADNAVTGSKLANDCVNSEKIIDYSISTLDLSTDGFLLQEVSFDGTTKFSCDIIGLTPMRFEGAQVDNVTLNLTLADVSMSRSILWPDLDGRYCGRHQIVSIYCRPNSISYNRVA
eukprot:536012_1